MVAGISRDSMHKRRATGGKKKAWRKKRKYELGRQPANTKLSSNKTVRRVRVRGGNVKWRALRLDTGNYSWGSEAVTRKTRILDVAYNASNNELVRTQTLVKSAIVQVDATPFKHWYLQHYGVEIGRKKKAPAASKKEATELVLEVGLKFQNRCGYEFLIEEKFKIVRSVIFNSHSSVESVTSAMSHLVWLQGSEHLWTVVEERRRRAAVVASTNGGWKITMEIKGKKRATTRLALVGGSRGDQAHGQWSRTCISVPFLLEMSVMATTVGDEGGDYSKRRWQ
ncbi:hypothetical protein GW17_00030258 [Ensete ventricosum]|nr:hypothetical protein GW17_00030258 [Ensete ventricosum]